MLVFYSSHGDMAYESVCAMCIQETTTWMLEPNLVLKEQFVFLAAIPFVQPCTHFL